jgi:general secretion pathway protein G
MPSSFDGEKLLRHCGLARAHRRRTGSQSGMTLIELIIACGVLLVLSSAALPIARFTVIRQREELLRSDLLDMRDAIDRYKEAADNQKIRVPADSQNYPPDLDTLVKGLPLANGDDKRIRFLRSIPIDPMTGKADWGLRGLSDDYDSTSWNGKNVFDVYSKSIGTAMNGTRYSDW